MTEWRSFGKMPATPVYLQNMKALATVRRAANILLVAWKQAAREVAEQEQAEEARDEEKRAMMVEVLEKALAAAREGKLREAAHLATHAFEVTQYAPFTMQGLEAFCKRVHDGGFPNEANLLQLAMGVMKESMAEDDLALELLLAQVHDLVCDWLRDHHEGDDEDAPPEGVSKKHKHEHTTN